MRAFNLSFAFQPTFYRCFLRMLLLLGNSTKTIMPALLSMRAKFPVSSLNEH